MNSNKYGIPNFLIVGAAKCGTSSLYQYLKQHPQIFLSDIKEPKFITSNFIKFPLNGPGDEKVEKSIVNNYNSYLKLFRGAEKFKRIGEASADTLYYGKKSIKVIKKYFKHDPSIIIIIRNPAERAFSAYTHMIREGREKLSFHDALRAEKERIKNNWEFIWHYQQASYYYESIKCYINSFRKVKIVLLDDLKNNTNMVIKDLYKFLDVDKEFTPENIRVYNISGKTKSNLLHKIIKQKNPTTRVIKKIFNKIGIENNMVDIQQSLLSKNIKKIEKPNQELDRIKQLFNNDINKLQCLINKDLTNWL